MSKRVRGAREQADRLIDEVHGLPVEPVGPHLESDELVEYSMGALSSEQLARMDTHLASCDDCSARIEHLLTVAEAWRGADGQRRLRGLSQRILEKLDAAESGLRALLPSLRAWAASMHFAVAPLPAQAATSIE